MKNLWAPWRKEFILSEKEKGCVFCNRLKQRNDKKNLILLRGKSCFVILNRFPYNSGHLMVSPKKHTGNLEKLKDAELLELLKLTRISVKVLKEVFKPHGFNLGMNLEKVSGAGIADHLHIHVVPRWSGDTNFMPVLSDTKVVSISLDEAYRKLKKRFEKIVL
ncbi:MAG: HIT family hydrolase [candidate division Zixibacteria bacterium SM23_73_2]|nr:MAG: HIT family hydrolase [candidate division Zixibacteria bacterium SM23_73_2]